MKNNKFKINESELRKNYEINKNLKNNLNNYYLQISKKYNSKPERMV